LFVDHLGTVYVADSNNHQIMHWTIRSRQGDIIVGENDKGKQTNQLNLPIGFSFDREGNLYVVDCDNHRLQMFNIDES